jgi:hypothetical protein
MVIVTIHLDVETTIALLHTDPPVVSGAFCLQEWSFPTTPDSLPSAAGSIAMRSPPAQHPALSIP